MPYSTSFDPDVEKYVREALLFNQQQNQAQQVPIQEPVSSNLFGRSLQQAANLPSNVLNTGMQAMVHLGLAPTSQKVPGFYDIPQARTTGEQAVDLIGGQLAPQLGWAALTYGLGGAAGKAVGLGKVGADIAGNVVSGFATGATASPEQAALGALFGGAYGAASYLPRAQRLLPLAGIGAADALSAYGTTGDAGWSVAQGAIGAGIGMLPGNPRALVPEGRELALYNRSQQVPMVQPSFEYLGPSPRQSWIDPVRVPRQQQFAPLQLDYTPIERGQNPSVMEAVYGGDIWRQREAQSEQQFNQMRQAQWQRDQDLARGLQEIGFFGPNTQPLGILPPNRQGMRRAESAAMTFESDPNFTGPAIQTQAPLMQSRSQASKLGWQKRKLNELFPGQELERTVDPITGVDVYQVAKPKQPEAPRSTLAPWDYPQESGLWNNTPPVKSFTQSALDFGDSIKNDPKALQSVKLERDQQLEIFNQHKEAGRIQEMVNTAGRTQYLRKAIEQAEGTINIPAQSVVASSNPLALSSSPLSETSPRPAINEAAKEILRYSEMGRGGIQRDTSGRLMLPPEVIGGTLGGVIGSQIGNTEEERQHNAAYGALLGFGVPSVGRVLGPDLLDMARRGGSNVAGGLQDFGVAAKESAKATALEIANVGQSVASNIKGLTQKTDGILSKAPQVILDETPLMQVQKELQRYKTMQESGIPVSISKVKDLEAQAKALTPVADVTAEINARGQFDPASRPDNRSFTITPSVPLLQKAAPLKQSFRFVETDPHSGVVATWELRQNPEGSYYVQKQGSTDTTRLDFNTLESATNYLDKQGLKLQDKGLKKTLEAQKNVDRTALANEITSAGYNAEVNDPWQSGKYVSQSFKGDFPDRQAHGTATVATLQKLLDGGIDNEKQLYTGALSTERSNTGMDVRLSSPFVLVAKPGVPLKSLKDLDRVLVADYYVPEIPKLKQLHPNVEFVPASDPFGKVAKTGVTGEPFVGPLNALYGPQHTPTIQPGYNPTGRPNQLNLIPETPNARTKVPLRESAVPVSEGGEPRMRQQVAFKRPGEKGYTDIRAPLTLSTTLAGTLAGGAYGAATSEGDVGNTLLFAGLGAMAGGVLSTSLLSAVRDPLTKAQRINQSIQPLKEAVKETLTTSIKDQAGRAIHGDPTAGSKLARMFERNGWKVPPEIKSYFTQASGAVSLPVQLLNETIKRRKNFNVPKDVEEAALRFNVGQSIDPSKLRSEILREGGLDEQAWKELGKQKKQPINYHSWEVDGQRYYIKPTTYTKINQAIEAEFRSQVPADLSDYADVVVAGRRSLTDIQEFLALGVPGAMGQKIKNSFNQYVTKTYDMFTVGKTPTWQEVQKAAKAEVQKVHASLLENHLGRGVVDSRGVMSELEFQQRLNSATPKQFATLQNYKTFDFAGSSISDLPAGKYMVGPDTHSKLETMADEGAITARIKQYIDTKKEEEMFTDFGGTSAGQQLIDTTLFKKRKTFTPEFEEMLGVTKDPIAQVHHAIDRLYSSAVASKYIDSIKDLMFDNGLQAAYGSQKEWIAHRDQIAKALATATSDDAPLLQKQLDEILTYKSVDQTGLRVGALKDAMVSRYVHDQLRGYNSPWSFWETAVGKGTSAISRFAKVAQAPYSPVTQVRNAITSPMFMWIGRATPTDAWTSVQALRTKNDNWKEMVREGILGVDAVTSEMRKNGKAIIDGTYDDTILSKLKKPFKNTHEFILNTYQAPDQLTRAATYLSAKTRWADKLNLPLDHPEVIAKAVEWTDRYTMNYDNIAPIIRNLRRAPFVNIYIGYAAEMARIAKNLAVDAVKGDAFGNRIHSMAILGALAGGAEGLQMLSESNLSPEDKKLWDQTQRLSPDYSRSRYKYVLGKDEKNNFRYLDVTPLVISDNYSQMLRAGLKGDWAGVMAVNPVIGWENTPAYKIIAEQVSGENLRNGREFRGFEDRVKAVAGAILPPWTPSVGSEWQKWGQAALGIENLKTGRKETIEGQISKYLTGVAQTSVNADTVKKSAMMKFRSELATQKAYLNDVMNTTLSPSIKEREIRKYKEAVEYITADLVGKIHGYSNILPDDAND